MARGNTPALRWGVLEMARQNEREAIRNLQRYLRQLSYFHEEIGEVPIDGIFDSATREALIAFQELEGLTPTGEADFETWERLYAAYLASLEAKSEPQRFAYFPQIPENYTLEVGEAQFLVSIVQNALFELALFYDGLENVPQSGVYDEETARGVRAFQGANGLPQTGGVDRATWNALAEAYNRNFANPYLKR